uniref:Uncharacterized protein n=1 Tax=Anguilla anguilla TaxID=7936 RepID=A0A0E9TX61_ANGAN
MLSHCPFRPEN